jgi:hypothetical protein
MNDSVRLFAFDLSYLTFSEGQKLSRMPVSKLGRYVKGGQSFTITSAVQAKFAENFQRRKGTKLMVDYNHGSIVAMETGDPTAGEAAGWIEDVDMKADSNGVQWADVEFTADARTRIAQKKYLYTSPDFGFNDKDKNTGAAQGPTLRAVALTNRPQILGMPGIVLSEGVELAKNEKEKTMGHVAKLDDNGTGAHVTCGECGAKSHLKFDEMAASEGGKKFGDHFVPKSAAGAGEGGGAAEDTPVAASELVRVKGRIDRSKLRGRVVCFDVAEALENERIALSEVQVAFRAGKILKPQIPQYESMALNDLDGFRELVKTMPVQVDLGVRGRNTVRARGGEDGGKNTQLSELQADIRTKVAAKRATNPALSEMDAYNMLCSEDPGLRDRLSKAASGFTGVADEDNDE